jgi:hypothetical protein
MTVSDLLQGIVVQLDQMKGEACVEQRNLSPGAARYIFLAGRALAFDDAIELVREVSTTWKRSLQGELL